jgi:hypothetical protein
MRNIYLRFAVALWELFICIYIYYTEHGARVFCAPLLQLKLMLQITSI